MINMLVSKGQQELEESLMQWKQKTHLIQSLTPDRNQAHMFDKVSGLERLSVQTHAISDLHPPWSQGQFRLPHQVLPGHGVSLVKSEALRLLLPLPAAPSNEWIGAGEQPGRGISANGLKLARSGGRSDQL